MDEKAKTYAAYLALRTKNIDLEKQLARYEERLQFMEEEKKKQEEFIRDTIVKTQQVSN